MIDTNWHCFQQIDAGLPEEKNLTCYQQADGEGGCGLEANEVDLDASLTDVEYANIDFSVLKRNTPRNVSKTHQSIETEYAEIMKKEKEGRKENAKVEGKMTEGNKGEMVDNKELKQAFSEEERSDNTEVYSNVKDIMNDIWRRSLLLTDDVLMYLMDILYQVLLSFIVVSCLYKREKKTFKKHLEPHCPLSTLARIPTILEGKYVFYCCFLGLRLGSQTDHR